MQKETMMDKMAIGKHVEYAAGKSHGYMDLSNGLVDIRQPSAKDALDLIVVAQ